jgi:hypothetical protein
MDITIQQQEGPEALQIQVKLKYAPYLAHDDGGIEEFSRFVPVHKWENNFGTIISSVTLSTLQRQATPKTAMNMYK